MTIIQRNFFRLLRSGAFGTDEQVEPMSAWKWRQLYSLARLCGLFPLLHDGIVACSGQFFMQVPADVWDPWQQDVQTAATRHSEASARVAALLAQLGTLQLRPILLEPWTSSCLYDRPDRHPLGPVVVFFPFATQGRKADQWARENGTDADSSFRHIMRYRCNGLQVEHRHRLIRLSNKLNSITLRTIIDQEWLDGGTSHVVISGQRIETLSPTLAMLTALLTLVKTALSEGLQLWQVVDLGMMLRKRGHLVDYVKLQSWIERLHFERVALVVSQLLTQLLGFSADEVPFVQESTKKEDINGIVDDLFKAPARGRAVRFLRYCPGEGLAGMMASITHSLGNVQE